MSSIIAKPPNMPLTNDVDSYYTDKKQKTTVFFYDFKTRYDPDEFTVTFGSDGCAEQCPATGLKVTSNPFTSTVPVGNDHPKWLHYYKDPAVLPDAGELVYEAEVSVKQHIPVCEIPSAFTSGPNPRVRNAFEDIRLASAGINVVDMSTWMVFDFFISDEMIYAFYERLPFGKTFWTNNEEDPNNTTGYAAFSNGVPVMQRAPCDSMRLGIGINKVRGYVKWYINGREVFSWERIGTRLPDKYKLLEHGGTAEIVTINSIYFGFGTFSLMDMALPNNYDRELVEGDNQNGSHLVELEANYGYKELYRTLNGQDRDLVDKSITFAVQAGAYCNDNHDIKLFGQGADIKIKYQKLIWIKDGC